MPVIIYAYEKYWKKMCTIENIFEENSIGHYLWIKSVSPFNFFRCSTMST